MSKAENRFQDRKHKERARRVLKEVLQEHDLANDERFVGKAASVHSRPCSCSLCCRSRHNPWAKGKYKVTYQEQRSNMTMKEENEE